MRRPLIKHGLLAGLFFLLLCLSACGNSSSPAVSAAPDSGVLRLAQEPSVRNPKYENQEDFSAFLAAAEPRFLIPGLNQAMTPQGISYSQDTGLVYISSYASGQTASVISAVDYERGVLMAEYFLYEPDGRPFTGHVGGIAVAEDFIYLSAKLDADGSYSLARLALSALPSAGSCDVTVETIIPMPVSPSFLNYSNGILWVGNFYHPEADYGLPPEMNYTTSSADGEYGCYILGYTLEPGGILEAGSGLDYPLPDYVLAAPDKIQGLAYSQGQLMLSQSYGRKNNSQLLLYRLDLTEARDTELTIGGTAVPAYILDSRRQSARITAMPMTEGLCLAPGGTVLVLFESGASRYSDGKYRTDQVWELELFPSV